MKPFDGVDFLELDSLLTPSEIETRAKARAFTEAEILPIVGDCYERAEFPRALVPKLAAAGYLGANLTGYGCAGLDETHYGLIMQELERGDSGIRTFCSVQSALVMYPIFRFGSDEQKAHWLPRLSAGEAIGAFGLTEPDHGSDPSSMVTRARRDGDGYVLDGGKKWIGNATIADVAVIWAKTDDGTVGGFLVEKDTPGFEPSLITGKLSLRVPVTAEIRLEGCRVPAAARLPGTAGLKSALQCLTKARFGIGWGVIGAAMACYHEAVGYAAERKQFGRPIGSFQLVQQKLVDMLTEITKMQLLTLQVSRLMQRGAATPVQISMLKRNNVAHALDIARAARDLLGARGITLEHHSGRHMCNLEAVKTYEGTHDVHTLILGEHITGERAFAPR